MMTSQTWKSPSPWHCAELGIRTREQQGDGDSEAIQDAGDVVLPGIEHSCEHEEVHAGDANHDREDECIVPQRMQSTRRDSFRDCIDQNHGPYVASEDSIEFPRRSGLTRQFADAIQLNDPN